MDAAGVVVRVLYFSDSYGPHDHRFLSAIVGHGEKAVFLRRRPGEPIEARPVPRGVEIVPPLEPAPRARRRLGVTLGYDLRRRLDEMQVDLVHAGPVQDCAWLAASAGFRPLVTMSWGSDLLARARFGLGRWLARATLRRTAAFLCDCRAVRDRASELGMDPTRSYIFPWGVDLEAFRPARASAARRQLGWQKSFVALCSRSWESGYGVETVVRAFVEAAKRRDDLRLILAGDGSLRPLILDLIERSGVAERVWLPGRVAYADLPMLYHAADLYLSASRSDGSSVSLLEAMACGLPALVSDIPGNREWVEPEVNGWWFEVGDSAGLATSILEAAVTPGELQRLGKASRGIVEERADWKANVPRMFEAYAAALAGSETSS